MALDVAQVGRVAIVTAIIVVVTFVVTHRSLSIKSSRQDPATSTKPAAKPLTYRIRGIPVDWDWPRLQSYLSEHASKFSPAVKSFATEIHGGSCTGTATFLGEPPQHIQVAQNKYLTLDKDFLGITTLYTPPVDDHELDIVVVSGLGGHAFGSFKDKKGTHMWLLDSLPYDLTSTDTERSMARVMLYGHKSTVAESESMQNLDDLSISFRESLLPLIKAFTIRPIILIGHSLGGLIIKQALTSIATQKENQHIIYENLLRAVRGIIFFGVPHDGMDIHGLKEMAGDKFNRLLIESLGKENSSMLRRLRADFNSLLKKFANVDIFCFYETEMSSTPLQDRNGKWNMEGRKVFLVSKSSATHCRLAENDLDYICPIAYSHSNMVKFERNDHEYDKVQERLRIMARRAVQTAGINLKHRTAIMLDDLTNECLRSLSFIDKDTRYRDIDKAVHGTCTWLLSNDAYNRWRSTDCGLLWIKGKPGSGKSTLLQYALDQFLLNSTTRSEAVIVSFFFHGRGAELQKTPLGFFRSILHQLLSQHPVAFQDLVRTFKQRRDTFGEPGEKWQWHEKELQSALKMSLSTILRHRPILLFVDALDEAGKVHATNLVRDFKLLIQSVPSNGQLHICFSCRHYPIIGGDCDFEVCLEDENANDISTYVQAQLSTSPSLAASTIPTTIRSRANGVFMWAFFVIQKVLELENDGCSRIAIEKSIDSSPPELDELYQRLIDDMDDKDASLRLMEWVCFSLRPMSLNEVKWAMVIPSDRSQNSLKQYEGTTSFVSDNKQMERRIKTLSRGLVEVVASADVPIMQFIHQSAKDFIFKTGLIALQGGRMNDAGGPTSAEAVAGKAHYRLGRACVQYLVMDDILREQECDAGDLVHKFPLLFYSVKAWIGHLQESQARGVDQDDILEYFSWPLENAVKGWRLIHHKVYAYGRREPFDCGVLEEGTQMIHIVARYQLLGPLKVILSKTKGMHTNVNIDARDSHSRAPISYAAENGHKAVVQLLLDSGKIDANAQDKDGQTPISFAARNGREAVVQLLLDSGKIDADAPDKDGRTLISFAAQHGHKAVVQLLLDSEKIDADSRNQDGRTPLSYAAERGHKAVAQLLLDSGTINVNAQDKYGQTPILYAARNGYEAVVQLLLDSGKIDANAPNQDGRTPISYAVDRDYKAVVQLLLDSGKIDANAVDKNGRTPISYAAYYGYQNVVQMLLDSKGIDANAPNKDGRTPMSYAAERCHKPVVQLLLDSKGIDANAPNKDGRTPISYAAERGHDPVVQLLLDSGEIDTNAPNQDGRTPISYAAQNGHKAVVQLLLDSRTINVNAQDKYGQTPILCAARNGYDAVVQILLDSAKVDANKADDLGQTPFSNAAENGQTAVVQLLLDSGKIDADTQDIAGRTPLSYAAGMGKDAVVQVLLDSGKVMPSVADHMGRTPLLYAVLHGHNAIAEMLLSIAVQTVGGIDLQPAVLLAAVKTDNTALVKLLLDYGAEINGQDTGFNTLQLAASMGHTEVEKLLLSVGAFAPEDFFGLEMLFSQCTSG